MHFSPDLNFLEGVVSLSRRCMKTYFNSNKTPFFSSLHISENASDYCKRCCYCGGVSILEIHSPLFLVSLKWLASISKMVVSATSTISMSCFHITLALPSTTFCVCCGVVTTMPLPGRESCFRDSLPCLNKLNHVTCTRVVVN